MSIKQPKYTGVGDSVQLKQKLGAWEISVQRADLQVLVEVEDQGKMKGGQTHWVVSGRLTLHLSSLWLWAQKTSLYKGSH